MYKYKDNWHADAGKILRSGNDYGYKFSDWHTVTELEIDISDMRKEGNFYIYSDGLCKDIRTFETYGELKARLIHKLFSNDDQIAIILNKDDSEEDLMIYNKMQEWRDWCGTIVKKIKSL